MYICHWSECLIYRGDQFSRGNTCTFEKKMYIWECAEYLIYRDDSVLFRVACMRKDITLNSGDSRVWRGAHFREIPLYFT